MSEKIKKRKIMLVGTGFVGMSFAYSAYAIAFHEVI